LPLTWRGRLARSSRAGRPRDPRPGRPRDPRPEQIHSVVNLQPPHPPLDPLAQLAATALPFVHKRAVDIDNRILVTESNLCSPPDKLLPERPGLRRRWIDLLLERRLKAHEVQKIAKQTRKAGWRDQYLQPIGPADLEPLDFALDPRHFDAVHLPGEAPTHEFLDRQMDTRRPRPPDAADVIGQFRAGVVPADPHRPI